MDFIFTLYAVGMFGAIAFVVVYALSPITKSDSWGKTLRDPLSWLMISLPILLGGIILMVI
jgi:hypothetical protein